MKGLPKFLTILGRICISLIFLYAGSDKLFHWQQTEKALSLVLSNWHSYMAYSENYSQFFASLLLWVPFLLIIATIFELLGGLLIFFGVKMRFGAFLLLIFLIPTTILFHQFWFLEGAERTNQMVVFFKNIAIIGGLFYILAVGGSKKIKPPSPSTSGPIKK